MPVAFLHSQSAEAYFACAIARVTRDQAIGRCAGMSGDDVLAMFGIRWKDHCKFRSSTTAMLPNLLLAVQSTQRS